MHSGIRTENDHMDIFAAIAFTSVSSRKEGMNNILRALSELKGSSILYCSKSYTDGTECAAVSNAPISCDIADTGRFDVSVRPNKLLFYTDKATAESVLSSEMPAYQAAKLWTRKECIFKMFNVRNPFPANALYNDKDEIIISDKKILTYRPGNSTVLSVMVPAEVSDIRIYELKGGRLYEKI